MRRIRVSMAVSLTKSDPEKFLNLPDGIIDWFRKNADRGDQVPYTIVGEVALPPLTLYRGGKEEVQTFASAAQGGMMDGTAASGPSAPAGGRATGGAAFKGRRQVSGVVSTQPTGVGVAAGESSDDLPQGFDADQDAQEVRRKRRERPAGSPDAAAAKIDLAKEAPIPRAPELMGEKDVEYRGVVVFTVQLRDKGAAAAPGMVNQ